MLIRAFQPYDFSQTPSLKWDSDYINYAGKQGWKVAASNPVVTRGAAAQLIANANGRNYDINDAVQYLLDTDLAGGKTMKTVAGFGNQDPLTRMEAITFVQRMKEKHTELKSCPAIPDNYDRTENVIVYKNDTYHFTLTLPLSWKDKYKVVEQSIPSAPHLHNFDFINKHSKYGGIIFTITVWPKDEWQTDRKFIIADVPVVKELGEFKDNIYIFHKPTDAQYDVEDATDVQIYNMMNQSAKTIPLTFELLP